MTEQRPTSDPVLAYYNEEFLDSDEGRPIRILAEYLQPLRAFQRERVQDTIVFFGSARLRADGPLGRYYEEARELARLVTEWSLSLPCDARRFLVCTGGGDGIMEAANRGATDAGGRTVGLDDSGRILSTSRDGTARIHARSGALVSELSGHRDRLNDGSFSPDGSRVATASHDGTARIWKTETGEPIARLEGHRGQVLSAAFRGGGDEVLTAGADGTARRWDPDTGGLIDVIPASASELIDARYSADDTRMAISARNGEVSLWDATAASHRVLEGHEAPVRTVRYGAEGARLVSASRDGTARVWNREGELDEVLRHDEPVRNADIAPSEGRVATLVGERGEVKLWQLDGRIRERVLLEGDDPDRSEVRFHPDGSRLLIDGNDASLYIGEPWQCPFCPYLELLGRAAAIAGRACRRALPGPRPHPERRSRAPAKAGLPG